MKNNIEHLYIHIPFCKEICTYCDFYRTKTKDENIKEKYILKIIDELKDDNNKYKTIYLGGGTPNYLTDEMLDKLLSILSLKLENKYEFTIECNPEFLNSSQAKILKKNKVNRVSLGVQTFNEGILKILKRGHRNIDVYNALKYLKENEINNISIDLIYNLPLLKKDDLYESFDFIKNNDIKHISFYSLEIKEGSILNKSKYKINKDIEEDQLEIIKKEFEKLNFNRYEISNWSISKEYESNHNKAYWDLKDWKSIGVSGYGFENNIYYYNEGNINDWKKVNQNWTKKDIYENIFIMGLRQVVGINLGNERNKEAFEYIKNKLNYDLIQIENNYLKAKNIDLLHNILLDII